MNYVSATYVLHLLQLLSCAALVLEGDINVRYLENAAGVVEWQTRAT